MNQTREQDLILYYSEYSLMDLWQMYDEATDMMEEFRANENSGEEAAWRVTAGRIWVALSDRLGYVTEGQQMM